VSGGEIGAIDGTLTFMVGGDGAALGQVLPVLAAMGKPERIVHVGESGAGRSARRATRSSSRHHGGGGGGHRARAQERVDR